MLAIIEVLRRTNPDHPALLGPWKEFPGLAESPPSGQTTICNPAASKLEALTATELNLLAYLVLAHHGKVRASLLSSPEDQEFPAFAGDRMGSGFPIRGVREGDSLPSVPLPGDESAPEVTLHLDLAAMGLSARYGASWTERVNGLLKTYGPFALAWLEAVVRAADMRASRVAATVAQSSSAGGALSADSLPLADTGPERLGERERVSPNTTRKGGP